MGFCLDSNRSLNSTTDWYFDYGSEVIMFRDRCYPPPHPLPTPVRFRQVKTEF